MRFYSAGRGTNAPTATLPAFSIISATTRAGAIRELELWNTTTNAAFVGMRKFSTAGTAGSTIDGGSYGTIEDGTTITPALTVKDSYTSTAPTLVAGAIKRGAVGAAIGSGIMWTFGDIGIIVPRTSSAGAAHCGVICPSGTGQILEFAYGWDE
jgi:hypothetical protein